MRDGTNGKGTITVLGRGEIPPAPDRVHDLAESCVRFVERATGVHLDYQPETLSVLDHYLEQARLASASRPEAAPLIAHATGAYFGEVVRRRHASWWRAEGDDPELWKIELEDVYLAFSPVALMVELLIRVPPAAPRPEEGDRPESEAVESPPIEAAASSGFAYLELEDDDRLAVEERLNDLPPVPEEEFYAPSTRLEVIDIAVEAIRARRMAAGEEPGASLTPDDYED